MAEQKIKTLWLASWFPSRTNILFGNFVQKQAQALASKCDIVVIFIVEENIKTYEIEEEFTTFKTIRVFYPKTTNRFLKLFRFAKAWYKGLKVLKKYQFEPDITHLHVLNPTGLVALYLYFFKRIPFVITEHWSGYNLRKKELLKFHYRWLIRLCGPFSSRIMGLTNYFVASMQVCGLKGNFTVIPNIVDTELFHPPVQTQPSSVCRLLHVSHLRDDHKNISGILRGIQILSQSRRDFQLTIIGPLERHEPYINLSKQLEISDLINFKPSMPSEHIAKEMQQHDAFIMFSNREGLPVVLLEALAVGIPVVASETGGIREWIDNDKGRVVEVGDIDNFARSLEDVITKIDTFSPQKIRQQVVEKCSNESVSEAIKNVYQEVLIKA